MISRGSKVILYEVGSAAFLLVSLCLGVIYGYMSGDVQAALDLARVGAWFSAAFGVVLLAGAFGHITIGLKNEVWPSVRAYWRGEKA